MNRLITILGPTAVGKTELTLRLAQDLDTAVISGDAYQVYEEFSIGTAKPSQAELDAVKHYLIDTHKPDASYNVADFQKDADHYIQLINDEKHIPILSGGTGLYVQSLLEGYEFSEAGNDPNVRRELDALYEREGLEGLIQYAKNLAAKHHIELAFWDKHRLFRAIELMHSGDIQSLTKPTKRGLVYDGPVIGLSRDRALLYERINRRVDLMVEAGLIEEVASLLAKGVPREAQAFKGIGYKEIILYLDGILSRDEAIDLVKQHTRQFAKRQITWYKRMPYIDWIHIEEGMNSDDIYETARQMLKEYHMM